MKLFALLAILLLSSCLAGCTHITYKDETSGIELKVTSLRPAGEAMTLAAELFGKGKIELDRQQGSTLGEVNQGLDQATGLPSQ